MYQNHIPDPCLRRTCNTGHSLFFQLLVLSQSPRCRALSQPAQVWAGAHLPPLAGADIIVII